MTNTPVRFWLDPLCPYCWITALWVRQVAPHRELDISWQPISLLVKNELTAESSWHGEATWSFGLMRVMESVRADEGEAAVGELYLELGRRIHHDGVSGFPAADALGAVGLPVGHAAAFDDEAWDAEVLRRHHEGLALVGDDVGTPIVAVHGDDGVERGIFGPVITAIPDLDGSLAIWDASIVLTTRPEFFELKRTRTSRPEPGPRP